jgi:pyruvate/2-oxoglutarate dehydrogenase complex dihydrolipoamide acyltransferase (E2) component
MKEMICHRSLSGQNRHFSKCRSTKLQPPPTTSKPVETPAQSAPATTTYASGHPSPAAAKILREGDVDASQVAGSGKDGRITKEDAAKAVENKASCRHLNQKPLLQKPVAIKVYGKW